MSFGKLFFNFKVYQILILKIFMEVIKNEENYQQISDSPLIKRKVVHLDHLMVTVIEFLDGPMNAPDLPHSHPHEQITYVASGILKLFIEDREFLLKEGDVFKVESNLKHCIQTLSPYVKLIDSFSPIREDFL